MSASQADHIFTNLMTSQGNWANVTQDDASRKIIPTTFVKADDSALSGNTGTLENTLIMNNTVSGSDFNRGIVDNYLNKHRWNTHTEEYDQGVQYVNSFISGITTESSVHQSNPTNSNPIGSQNISNSHDLLPFIHSTNDVTTDTLVSKIIPQEHLPDTTHVLSDYSLFQSIIQNTIFEGFGAYSTTQGFQQNIMNLVMSDDSNLFGGYNFGTSSALPLLVFDISRQFLNSKLKLRFQGNTFDSNESHNFKHHAASHTILDDAHKLVEIGNYLPNKMYRSAAHHDFIVAYEEAHTAKNLHMDGLKGPDSATVKSISHDHNSSTHQTCDEYLDTDTPAHHGLSDYIEISMEELRRELFKTMACPQLFGQIFIDQEPVPLFGENTGVGTFGPAGVLDEGEFEYDQTDPFTWKGGQIRLSNINEARLWLLQYRNWLIAKLKEHNLYRKIKTNQHPLLKSIGTGGEIKDYLYTLDSFTIALITGGASLPDLYANLLNNNQTPKFNTIDNNDSTKDLSNCGLLANNDFLQWAYLDMEKEATSNTDRPNEFKQGLKGLGGADYFTTNTTVSGILSQQSKIGFGQQIFAREKTISSGSSTSQGLWNTNSTSWGPDLTVLSSNITGARYQYRNTDSKIYPNHYLSQVNFNPTLSKYEADSNHVYMTSDTNLSNNFWNDEVCAGITKEWVLPVNIKQADANGISQNNYFISGTTQVSAVGSLITLAAGEAGTNLPELKTTNRGNPGFLTNDVFNVSNWAWNSYQNSSSSNHKIAETNGDVHSKGDFDVGTTLSERNGFLFNVKDDAANVIYPRFEDPRQITRTFCHNAYGASIKIMDPIRQLSEAADQQYTWLCTPNGHLIKADDHGDHPVKLTRKFGYGFCMGDLISVGQSHHFNIGSRITSNLKRNLQTNKARAHNKLPIEFNAVVNCEFAMAFHVVDRATNIVSSITRDSTTHTDLSTLYNNNKGNYAGLPFSHELEHVNDSAHAEFIDIKGDIYNDLYNLSLIYLMINNKSSLTYLKSAVDDTDILRTTLASVKHFETFNNRTVDFVVPLLPSEQDPDPSFTTVQAAPTANTTIYGTNLLFHNNGGYYYPSSDVTNGAVDQEIITYYGDETPSGNDIEVSPSRDFMNIYLTFIKNTDIESNAKGTLINYQMIGDKNSNYTECCKVGHKLTATNYKLNSTNKDHFGLLQMYVPIWNTSLLRHSGHMSENVLRGMPLMPIDNDLQSGVLIAKDQFVTYDGEGSSEKIAPAGQEMGPNPMLFTSEADNNVALRGARIVPTATLNLPQYASAAADDTPAGTGIAPVTGDRNDEAEENLVLEANSSNLGAT